MRMTSIKAALAAGGLVLSLLQPALAADKQKFYNYMSLLRSRPIERISS